MAYRIYGEPFIIHTTIYKTERATQIARDLAHLHSLGYCIEGIVTDGGRGVTKARQLTFPFTPHQICLAHVHRQATLGLGKQPKDYRLKRLKQLANHLFLIESQEALRWWLGELKTWTRVNRDYLAEKGHDEYAMKSWFKHPQARKTVRVLAQAARTSFTFLDYPLMPKTTNGIEGIFSNTRIKWLIHRGLKQQRWPNFLLWFVYFRNQQLMADKNKTNA